MFSNFVISKIKFISGQVIDQMAWNATIAMKELTVAWIYINMSVDRDG